MDAEGRFETTKYPFILKLEDIELLGDKLERIARAQEGMLAIAAEARVARLELSAQLQAKLKQPFEGK